VQCFLTFGFGWIIGLDLGVNLITSRVALIAAIASLGRANYAGAFGFIFFALIWCSVGRMGEQPATLPGAAWLAGAASEDAASSSAVDVAATTRVGANFSTGVTVMPRRLGWKVSGGGNARLQRSRDRDARRPSCNPA
jgi:hypothetical protein